jgi:sterol desaturase/sphingolipid hydroxylase (fatty acid hydroxylase superfamily)
MEELWRGFIGGLPSMETYVQLLAVIGGFLVAEHFFPAERGQPLRNRIHTAEFTLLYFLLTPTVVLLPIAWATAIAKATGGGLFSLNLNTLTTGSNTADWLLRNILFPFVPFIVFDFFYYWHHRLQHTIPAFWAQHKLHHTDESVYCLSSGRHHWLEEGIRVFTCTIPMAFLFTLGHVQGVVMVIVLAQWAIFIHTNVRLPLGPLTPILTGPQLHRIHHSREPQHANKNFAAFVPLWDIVFGTYYRPLPNEWPATGVPSRETVTNMWAAAVMPFQAWGRSLVSLVRRRRAAS